MGPCRSTGVFLFATPSLSIKKFPPKYGLVKVRLEVAAYWLRS
jgi:hypothetical protein